MRGPASIINPDEGGRKWWQGSRPVVTARRQPLAGRRVTRSVLSKSRTPVGTVRGVSARLICVTGTGRCGTGFVSAWLRAAGLDVGHERLGRDGISAADMTVWLSAGARGRIAGVDERAEFRHRVHLVREPFACVGSLQTAQGASWRFVCRHSATRPESPLLRRCVEHWVHWNRLAEAVTDVTVRVEAWEAWAGEHLGLAPQPVGSRVNSRRGRYRPIGRKDVERAAPDLLAAVDAMAVRYGYPRPGREGGVP